MLRTDPLTFYEFFAGVGMANIGLGQNWRCLFANDFDASKARIYRANHGDHFHLGSISDIHTRDLPGRPALVWGSPPCQSFSLAGKGAGWDDPRANVAFAFMRIINELEAAKRGPNAIVIENVPQMIGVKHRDGLIDLLRQLPERFTFGAVIIDAAPFVFQRRKRVFLIALDSETAPTLTKPAKPFHTPVVETLAKSLPDGLRERWRWWNLGEPEEYCTFCADVALGTLKGRRVEYSFTPETFELMSDRDDRRFFPALEYHFSDENWVQFYENAGAKSRGGFKPIGPPNVAPTLRKGGKDFFAKRIRVGTARGSALFELTPEDMNLLMGLPPTFKLLGSKAEQRAAMGDGVAPPVVRFLAERLLEPALTPTVAQSSSPTR